MLYYTFLFGILMCCILDSTAKMKKSKKVITLLNAKWDRTPLVLETAEYLADENIDFYWSFIDSISGLNPPLAEIENDNQRYYSIINEASKFINSAELAVLKLGLSLHIYSPKIEMFSQMAAEIELPLCQAVVDVGGTFLCRTQEVEAMIKNFPEDKNGKLDVYRVDTHYPGSENKSLTVILYGELGTREFASHHTLLKQYAIQGDINYIVRHYVQEHSKQRLRLSGYGVELQMKSTEYKVQDDIEVHDKHDEENEDSTENDFSEFDTDFKKEKKVKEGIKTTEEENIDTEGFNFAVLKSRKPNNLNELNKLKQHLEESSSEMAPLKVWQFQELSLQAAERIMNAPKEEALKVFTEISQNFPKQAKSLVKTVVKSELKNEIKKNQDIFAATLNLQPSDTALFVNGMYFDLDLVDIYTILEALRQELRTMQRLHAIGVNNDYLKSLLSLDFSESGSGMQEFAMDIRDSAIIWINDIENDSQYSRWPTSVLELLKPTFPGMLRQVRRNLFNLVLILNPISTEIRGVLKLLESLVVHSAPLRVGLVFSVNADASLTGLDDAGVAMLCAFNFVSQKQDAATALNFLSLTLGSTKETEITVENIKDQLKKKYNADSQEVLGEDSIYDFGRQLSDDFIRRSGLRSIPQALLNGIPLQSSQLNIDDFEEAILQEVMSQTPLIQKHAYSGKLTDRNDVVDFLMSQPNVMPRLNARILNKDSSAYLDMTGKAATLLNVQGLLKLSNRDMTATAIENLKYFALPKKGQKYYSMTYWIVGDLNCAKSRKLLIAALEHLKANGDVRISFLPNVEGDNENLLNKIVLAALQELPSNKAINYILSLLNDEEAIANRKPEIAPEIEHHIKSQDLSLKMLRVYAQKVLHFKAGERGIIANGRVIGPLESDEDFIAEDFSLLDKFSFASYGEKITTALKKSNNGEDITSDAFMRIVSLLVSSPQTRTRFDINFSGNEYSVLKLSPLDPNKPVFKISAIVDPVSRGAQKLGPILQVLTEVLNCEINIFLNSIEKNSDMPVKSFYRYVLESEVQFDEDGKQSAGPTAIFTNMPTAPLLTQNIHVPENWLVEVVRSVYDLDNIRLENVDSVVYSEYELEYLLVEGHCFEANTGSPPRGLQITLGTTKQPVVVDTIVMANLGYFQLKANPGAWILRLRQGRSADIYDIISHDGSDTPENSTDIKVLISSLRSTVLKLKVSKKPDKYHMDLLSENDGNTGIWNSITSSFSGSEEDSDDKLNIFSLASGHLYERFIRIMMLSVVKHTKTPVKFWFLKNYLSPQLKDFLPYMAKQYGFEYELVQYKWPRWLYQQTEKQRIIWGYKILFLDVLFPLDVKKIIFVDADQVVRADMKELQQLDLGGAPYGYTPFCDSRTEMDGFRFWKQGYWRNHLQGRKYHISALYVVDLKRFRRIAAGDRLRGQYQALSQDPNSLSNLDQDLPNNMVHQVAIKSLPQEWLWCETWCDDESKTRAKTIDLCNNPMTKEAKLTAAMRIVPEWKAYDEEIRKLQQKIDSGVLDSDPAENFETERTDVHTEL